LQVNSIKEVTASPTKEEAKQTAKPVTMGINIKIVHPTFNIHPTKQRIPTPSVPQL